MITIGCRDSSHEGKSVIIAKYRHESGEWRFVPYSPPFEGDRPASICCSRPRLALAGDEPIGDVLLTPALKQSIRRASLIPRHRYRLACQLCGLTVTRREETLSPVLERLAAAGVTYLELAHLERVR